MGTPGNIVSGWWDCHNSAFYLDRLVHQSSADEIAEARDEAPETPALSLLWRPIPFPKSAAAKQRAALKQDVPRPRGADPKPADH